MDRVDQRARLYGNVSAEYGILIGTLAVLAIGAVTLLGKNTTALVSDANGRLDRPDMRDYMQLQFGRSSTGINSTALGNQAMRTNPETGLPTIDIADGGGSPVNATSVEGLRIRRAVATDTIELINQLKLLANTTTDESTRLWIELDLIRWMGGLAAAEGYAARIGSLTASVQTGAYSEAQALADIEKSRNNLLYKRDNNTYALLGSNEEIVVKPSPAMLQAIKDILNKAVTGTRVFVPSSGATAPNWDLGIYTAYGNDQQRLFQSLDAAQADGTINQNATVAETAAGVDELGTIVP